MYKKGFTLQELLISLAIVGVVAALVMPMLSSLRPNKTKTTFMKVYNTLTTQTAEILDNSSLYWDEYDEKGVVTKSGLYSTARPQIEPYMSDANCGTNNKFAAIMAHNLAVIGTPTYTAETNSIATFTTTNGVNWRFETSVEKEGTEIIGNKVDVTVNVNPSDKSNNNPCLYDTTCTKPNQFKFRIHNDGGIEPADALGMAYLQNSTDMRLSSDDTDLAAKIIAKAKSSTDVDAMLSALNTIVKK